MWRTYAATPLLFAGLTFQCLAQSPLAKAFSDMHSSDPVVVNQARQSLAGLTEKELPTIEKDTATLCNGLSDSDAMIRQQASGILLTIALIAHEHNQVVVSCFPQLIVAANDFVDRIRNNSLFALAINPAGPPEQAHDVFVKSLGSANFRTAELGAAGLLKESSNAESNQKLVQQALENAPDAKHRQNILYAISGSKVPSDALFQVSQKYIDDPSPTVQHAAIDAVAATGDKSKVATVMQNLEGSSSASIEQKKHAEAVLNGLKSSQ
jgi:hypothetical protein